MLESNVLLILTSYGIGTVAGVWLFKRYVQEEIIIKTIDSLVENDFCRSYTNEDGEVELYKWYDLDDLLEGSKVTFKVNEEENDDA